MSDQEPISLSEEESEDEGPGIKPPQASRGERDGHNSGGDRHRSSSNKKRRDRKRSREDRDDRRKKRHKDEDEDRERDRSNRRDDRGSRDRRDRDRGDSNRDSQDLRHRLNRERFVPNERNDWRMERDLQDLNRMRRVEVRKTDSGGTGGDRSDWRNNPFLRADQHREESRRDVDARRKRKLIEMEMEKLQARIGRKVDAGSRDNVDRTKKKSESGEESGEDESGESGEGETESDSDDGGSDATTGSQKSEDTPDRHESEGELDDDEMDTQPVVKNEKSSKVSDNKSRWADRSPSQERTPSRSPTPMRELRGRGQSLDPEDSRPTSGLSGSPKDSGLHHSDSPAHRLPMTPQKLGPNIENTGPKLPVYLPSVHGCRSVAEFQCINRIEEGTYGVVYRARDKRTKEIVALKKLKMEREKEGFPITSLREINTLLIAQHVNVVTVREIVVGSNMDQIFIVMDFVQHDLKSLMETMRKKNQVFLPAEVKCLMDQLLRAVHHLHDNWILHRDLKASNLLLSHNGILKVGDFGLAREYGSPLKNYTAVVVTLWYRAPELLLGIKQYSTHIDVWSIGCIFGELLLMEPLFPGKSEVDELNRIFKLLGTPSEKIWPGYKDLSGVRNMKFVDFPVSKLREKFPERMLSEGGLDLMKALLTYDPVKRITCEQGMKHKYFDEMPRAIDPSMFPTWPAKSEQDPAAKTISSPKPPSGGGAFKNIDDDEARVNRSRGFDLVQSVKNNPPAAGWNLKF